jgi:hypothetical protein
MLQRFNFLLGPSGKVSAMRVNTTLVVAGFMAVWAYTSVKKLDVLTVSPEWVVILLGSLGIKAWQRTAETEKRKTES